ncbi:MAG: aminoacyl-tRNA hydrolase, partial [Acidimicrobiales bacterium]
MADPAPPSEDVLVVTRGCRIPLSELTWRFTTSGGPGGQHANRSHTAAEVVFDVEASAALGPRQRSRLLDKIGPVVRASASEERSQAR